VLTRALVSVLAAGLAAVVMLAAGSAGRRPIPGLAVAASVCGAIEALTRALAVELTPVRVNAVALGPVRSPLWDSMSQADRDRLFRDTAASVPAGRIGEPADIAQAYLYCLTQPFATGTVVTVDGGTVLV
jgi:NAD(P)-dependent dehydrogenase (short-subunit alcohol dehydrogenase family)